MDKYLDFYALCEKIECEYSTSAMLKDYTSFKIGGKADVMVFPDTLEKINQLFYLRMSRGFPFLFWEREAICL